MYGRVMHAGMELLPILLGSLIQQLYVAADAVIVGQFNGKGGGATILISRFYGAKDRESLHCSIRTAYTVAVVLGVLCSVAGVLMPPFFLDIMAVAEYIYEQTAAYTRIYSREQRAKWVCSHAHLATAARVNTPLLCSAASLMPRCLQRGC